MTHKHELLWSINVIDTTSASSNFLPQAFVVSKIAHLDWPDLWPELFDVLLSHLKTGSADEVHGSMRVLAGESPNWFCIDPLSLDFFVSGSALTHSPFR